MRLVAKVSGIKADFRGTDMVRGLFKTVFLVCPILRARNREGLCRKNGFLGIFDEDDILSTSPDGITLANEVYLTIYGIKIEDNIIFERDDVLKDTLLFP